MKKLIATSLFLLMVSIAGAADGDAVASRREQVPNKAAPAEQVEYFWSKPAGEGPFPLVVFLHGHQDKNEAQVGGKAFVNWGVLAETAGAGRIAVAVSQPGFGTSGGAADQCGPRTQAAVETVIAQFRAKPFVDAKHVAIQGISCGASVAAKIATRDPDLAAVVLIAGAYDFAALYAGRCKTVRGKVESMVSNSLCWNLEHEMPPTQEGFEERSTLGYTRSVKAAVLILHGGNDPMAPVEQARELERALKQSGVAVESKVFSSAAHAVPLKDRTPIVDAFLAKHLTGPSTH